MHTSEYGYFTTADLGSVRPGDTIAPFIPVTGGGRSGATMEGGGAIEDPTTGGRSGGTKDTGAGQVKDDGGRPGATRGEEEIIFTEEQGPLDAAADKKEEGKNTMLYWGLGIAALVLIIVVVILIARRRKQKQVTKK